LADSEDKEKEQPATQRQRDKFAERGDTPRSRELISAMTLTATSLVLLAQGPTTGRNLTQFMRGAFAQLGRPPDGTLVHMLLAHYAQMALPMGGAAIGVALMGSVLQRQGRLTWKTPSLDFGRLDPIAGLMKLFDLKTAATNMAATVGKVAVLAGVLLYTWYTRVPQVVQHTPASLGTGLRDSGDVLYQILQRGLWTLLVLGALDYILAWWRIERQMRMSIQDIRDEGKEANGNPAVRSKRRKAHQELVRSRSLKDVPRADVVLVNPTHVAVAVRYAAGEMAAPRVVAKGADHMAERIRQIARKNGVPVVSQPPLARLLYAQVKVGRSIPADMYKAVAVVLAHVYRLKKRA
jgi:flagellar biosynthetic protein FlhB